MGAFFEILLQPILDFIAALLAPFFEIFATIILFFLDAIIQLIAALLGMSWAIAYERGLRRWSLVIATLAAVHILATLALAIIGERNTVLLSSLFSAPALIASILIFVLASFVPTALRLGATYEAGQPLPSIRRHGKSGLRAAGANFLNYILAAAIVFGGLAIWSSTHERRSLREQLCAAAEGQVPEKWLDRGKNAANWLDRLSKVEINKMNPCNKAEKPNS